MGWKFSFSFFLKVSALFPVRSKSLSKEKCPWNEKQDVLFYLCWGIWNPTLAWEWQAWEKSVRRYFYSLDLSRKFSLIFSNHILVARNEFLWRLLLRYFYNRKASQNNNAMLASSHVLSTSSNVGAHRIPSMRRKDAKSKNIPEICVKIRKV